MRTYILLFLVSTTLVSCSSPEERARKLEEKHQQACKEFGLTPGNDAFELCMIDMREAEERRKKARMAWPDGMTDQNTQSIYRW